MRETCSTCFGDGTITNGSAGPDTAPGSVTWCQTCFGRGWVEVPKPAAGAVR